MREYIGKPYHPLARGPESYDCWGLVMAYYKDYRGIDLIDYQYVGVEEFKKNAEIYKNEELTSNWDKTNSPKQGDIVVFNVAGYPVHVGIMVDSTRFMHAHESCDVAVESVYSHKWSKRLEGYYRHK